jgi:hypothetical protein
MIAIMLMKATPDGSLSYKYTALSGSKKAMDCVTVLCSSDRSGSDKWKFSIIGKRAKPQCFKGIPVLYYANKNEWMISEIFKKWPMSWNMELQWKSRTDLLVLHNCAPHCHLDSFKKYITGISVPQHHILGTANGHGTHKKLEDLISRKVGKPHP